MNRRQFLTRSALTLGVAAIAPALLPHCQECGQGLLIELLSGNIELCADCRAARPVIIQGWGAFRGSASYKVGPYTSITELNDLFKKTHEGMITAFRRSTAEFDWIAPRPLSANDFLVLGSA